MREGPAASLLPEHEADQAIQGSMLSLDRDLCLSLMQADAAGSRFWRASRASKLLARRQRTAASRTIWPFLLATGLNCWPLLDSIPITGLNRLPRAVLASPRAVSSPRYARGQLLAFLWQKEGAEPRQNFAGPPGSSSHRKANLQLAGLPVLRSLPPKPPLRRVFDPHACSMTCLAGPARRTLQTGQKPPVRQRVCPRDSTECHDQSPLKTPRSQWR